SARGWTERQQSIHPGSQPVRVDQPTSKSPSSSSGTSGGPSSFHGGLQHPSFTQSSMHHPSISPQGTQQQASFGSDTSSHQPMQYSGSAIDQLPKWDTTSSQGLTSSAGHETTGSAHSSSPDTSVRGSECISESVAISTQLPQEQYE
ncbi:hypothetical protein ADUPG1_006837, partial [Aduncisulcus paluster]